MPQDLFMYFNPESFVLSIVILLCIIITVSLCVLVFLKNTTRKIKFTFLYLTIILLLYETSSLLFLYPPPNLFKSLCIFKIISSILLNTGFLYFFAIYINNKLIIKSFLFVHLSSYLFIFGILFFKPFENKFFIINAPSFAEHTDAIRIYISICALLYIATGIIFYFSNQLFKQKKRYLFFLIIFITLNVSVLVFSTFASKDIAHEKMPFYLLLILLSFLFKFSPFYEKKDVILFSSNILHSISETVIILDKYSKTKYIQNNFKNIDILEHIDEIIELINKEISQIKLTIDSNTILHLQYKTSNVIHNNKNIGKIIILRDISNLVELSNQIEHKNNQLILAFNKKKLHLKAIQKLQIERERAEILAKVNECSNRFISILKSNIENLRLELDEKNISKGILKNKNEELITITKNTIDEIRNTVKQIYKSESERIIQ